MPDITMCSNNVCPKKNECYRFLADPDHYQSYSDFLNSCNEMTDYAMKLRPSVPVKKPDIKKKDV